MLDGRLRTNFELRGFTLIGNVIPYFHVFYMDLEDFKISKEAKDLEILSKEIKNCIICDLLEAIENDLEVKNNCNPEKWVKEMFKEGLL